MTRRGAFFLLRLALGLGLLLYLALVIARPREIVAVLGRASLGLLLLAFALHAFGLLFSALRWKLILDRQQAGFGLLRLTGSLLVGSFFNLFLPTRFGGDVVRVSDTRRIGTGLTGSLAVVVYERMSGIVALLAFAVLASLLRLGFVRRMPMLYVSLLAGVGGLALLVFAWKRLPRGWLASRPCRRPWLRRLLDRLDAFHGVILDFLGDPGLLRRVLFWAVLLQCNVVLHYFVIGRALGLARIPLLDYFFSIPIMLFVLSLPISINGLGVRDLFLVQLFVQYGYPAEFAIAFSAVDLAYNAALGAIGGLVYVFRRR
ncbi:MAG TPA: lysylphosphatidylglycerol synthase transmembrane domain-containing protein [Candidatus Aminicenantes bacterium]|nr:lysylphosphatidylglycerol synthase transmembrane domain-containing protein [Candidatus Aminicenantes bacterium]